MAKKKATVYVVTSGSYSDYGIRAIFSTQELAQAYIDKANAAETYWASDTTIEEWPLDGEAEAKLFTRWKVGMLLDDGSVKEGPCESQEFGHPESKIEQYGNTSPCYANRPIVRVVSVKSAQHALKMAAEARQKWLREKGGK